MPDLPQDDTETMNVVEEGELAGDEVAGNKVFITGTGTLGTSDIQNFGHDHFSGNFEVEWIDDDNVNLVYGSNELAAEALKALSVEWTEDPLQERRAKALITHPDVSLWVRMARNTDVKQKGAAERSRYYLLHPEQDPMNRPRRQPRRGGRRGGGYEDRRMSRENTKFDVDLYDDDPAAKAATAKRRMSQHSSLHSDDGVYNDNGRNKIRRVHGRGDDLIVDKREGRLRNRSASPMREGDGRFGFSDDQPYRKTARRRTPPPVRSGSHQANKAAGEKLRKELFPSKKTGTPLTNGFVDPKRPVELFPKSSSQAPQELFPEKVNHRRQDAKDIGPDEVANAIGKCDLFAEREQPTYDQPGRRPENGRVRNDTGKPRDLFDRISAPSGRLNERPSSEGNDGGFSIRGAGQPQNFSFKGASRDAPPVTELFPKKDLSKDLFAHKMQGRGAQRRMAEDSY